MFLVKINPGKFLSYKDAGRGELRPERGLGLVCVAGQTVAGVAATVPIGEVNAGVGEYLRCIADEIGAAAPTRASEHLPIARIAVHLRVLGVTINEPDVYRVAPRRPVLLTQQCASVRIGSVELDVANVATAHALNDRVRRIAEQQRLCRAVDGRRRLSNLNRISVVNRVRLAVEREIVGCGIACRPVNFGDQTLTIVPVVSGVVSVSPQAGLAPGIVDTAGQEVGTASVTDARHRDGASRREHDRAGLHVRLHHEGEVARNSLREGSYRDVIVVAPVHDMSESHLFDVRKVLSLFGSLFGLRKDREENGGEDRDNRDDHEKFDKGESSLVLVHGDVPMIVKRANVKSIRDFDLSGTNFNLMSDVLMSECSANIGN